MALIEWDDAFSINHQGLDLQHRTWVEIINRLHDELSDGTPGNAMQNVVSTLRDMLKYARSHFLAEEKFMRQIGFPGTIDHIKLHNECYARISSYLFDVEAGENISPFELMCFLRDWLVEHILSEDKKFGVHAMEAGYSGKD